ncbi:hypothetical protein Tsubulata_035938 [Turnera subulata]|uniref:Uncharacterized protein n=1 Tax=Turnera subulata TaxID=218843 RepID=A0A9Q0GLH8_9ROSI|nr:hypothetical protein Tsubulata_035938 [Turnera subulata]
MLHVAAELATTQLEQQQHLWLSLLCSCLFHPSPPAPWTRRGDLCRVSGVLLLREPGGEAKILI